MPYSAARPHHPPDNQHQPPAIFITAVMSIDGTIAVPRNTLDGTTVEVTLHYRIFRPRQLKMQPPPLLVLHGGPCISSTYLVTMTNVITDRAIIFYDQIGCGRSTKLNQRDPFSIEESVNDLQALIQHLKLRTFHLYGHSFGGILAFEYCKRMATATANTTSTIRSVILSSTPTSIQLVLQESQRLLQELKDELVDDDDVDDKHRLQQTFQQTHQCRVVPLPLTLTDAYAAGTSVWRGMEAFPDYVAQLSPGNTTEKSTIMTPALILQGQHDFVTQRCVDGWRELLLNSQQVTLAGCSHYGLLENEDMYGAVIGGFIEDHD
jgi:proline iminopeptidase